jgi:hypothetical protein
MEVVKYKEHEQLIHNDVIIIYSYNLSFLYINALGLTNSINLKENYKDE